MAAPSRLDGLKFNVHTLLQKETPDKLKQISSKLCLPIHLMLFNLDGNMNIAMSVRSAAVMGCSDVWIVGKPRYDARPEVGSKNYIKVHKIPNLSLNFFSENHLNPIIVEQGGIPVDKMNFTRFAHSPRAVCFIMGSESLGIPKTLIDSLPDAPIISITQRGLVRSLNVSIAASIIIYEYTKWIDKTLAL